MESGFFRHFSHVMVYVNDVSRALAWYRDTLGFEINFNDAPHYASLKHDEWKLRIDLHPDKKGGNVGHGAEIYFIVDDINKATAALRGRGLTVPDPKSEGDGAVWFTSFKDSEGNTLGIWEERFAK
jgi:predicted enzyme related to lactoylglutathione lyase